MQHEPGIVRARTAKEPSEAPVASQPQPEQSVSRRFDPCITANGRQTIPRVEVTGSLGLEAAHERCTTLLRSAEVFIISRSGVLDKLLQHWDVAWLREALAQQNTGFYVSNCPPDRFMHTNNTVNHRSSIYHVCEPETRHIPGTFDQFVDACTSWHTLSAHYHATLFDRVAHNAPTLVSTDASTEAQHSVSWHTLLYLLNLRSSDILRIDLQSGRHGSQLPAFHHNRNAAIVLQISAQRRVLAIPPSSTYRGMYPFPINHPFEGYVIIMPTGHLSGTDSDDSLL